MEALEFRRLLAVDLRQIADIHQGLSLEGSNPRNIVTVGSVTYFTATTTATGEELWKTDGTLAGTTIVKDIQAGMSGSDPGYLTNVAGTLYFRANDGASGLELWKSDGTAAGTELVHDIRAGAMGSNPAELIALDERLFFRATDGILGVELWRSEGTAATTVQIADLNPMGGNSTPTGLTVLGTAIYFAANDGSSGYEFWRSEGTEVTTTLVSDIRPGSGSSQPSGFTRFEGSLYFRANDGSTGAELWRSDGTPSGTAPVVDLRAGDQGSGPSGMTVSNGKLYFSANDGASGTELWSTSGTAGTTSLVQDINPGSVGSDPTSLTEAQGLLFFAANDGSRGREVWISDGSFAGTQIAHDVFPGTTGSQPSGMVNLAGTVYFAANDGTHGEELWKSNAAPGGTSLVSEIRITSLSASPRYLTASNGRLYFRATDGAMGGELWASDGTQEGTLLVRDIRAGTSTSYLRETVDVNGTLFFTASDGVHGLELWRSDGTAAGTTLVKDIRAGNSWSYPRFLTNMNGRLYFNADDGLSGRELWTSDGSEAGTTRVQDIFPGLSSAIPRYLTNFNGTLFFAATSPGLGYELWKSDGSATGTSLVKDINPGSSTSNASSFLNIQGTLYFKAYHNSFGYELWKTDGSTDGTVLVKDIRPGVLGSFPYFQTKADFTNVNGTLYFRANDGTHGEELWKSEGTSATTALVKDIRPGGNTSGLGEFTNLNGTLYFRANDGTSGRELWTTDGSSVGTTRVADIQAGLNSSDPTYITVHDGRLYFAANDGTGGQELWSSDGTAGGTSLVKEFRAGPAGSRIQALFSADNRLFITANDGVVGEELWISDGTGAGTELSEDVAMPGGARPTQFFSATFGIVFLATTDEFGQELWTLNEANEPPTAIQFSGGHVPEANALGAVAATLSTVDLNPDDTFTYTFASGTGDEDNGLFTLDGEVLRAAAVFDFETRSSYSVRVRSTDFEGLFVERAIAIVIDNLAPVAPEDTDNNAETIPEGAPAGTLVGLTMSSTDPAGGVVQYTLANDAAGRFAIDPISGIVTVASGETLDGPAMHTITVRASDGLLATTRDLTIAITNVAPEAGVLQSNFNLQSEGGSVTVTGSFTDPAMGQVTELISVEVAWGNGVTTPALVDQSLGTYTATYVYPDDHPQSGTPSDDFTIQATISDGDGGSVVSAGSQVSIFNTAPTLLTTQISATSSPALLPITVSGSFNDPALGVSSEEFVVWIDWGNGIGTAAVVNQSQGTFTATYTYPHAPPVGGGDDTFPITITVNDDDSGATIDATHSVVVSYPPLALGPVNVDATTITEGSSVTVAGLIASPNLQGPGTNFSVNIDWGDGSSSPATLDLNLGTYSASHPYVDDNPTASVSDIYPLIVTVVDGLGNQVSDNTRSITVVNSPPTNVSITGIPAFPLIDIAISLDAMFVDLGAADTHAFEWTVTRNAVPYASQSGATSPFAFTPDSAADYVVSLTVIDDDGGFGTVEQTVSVRNDTLRVSSVQVGTGELSIQFNRAIDPSVLNLYDGPGPADAADVTLVGIQSGAVRGSLLWDATAGALRFVKTGGPLAPDTYMLTLRGAPNGIQDTSGDVLDGDGDLVSGGDFTQSIVVDVTSSRTLSLKDFARGPSQPVDDTPIQVPASGLGVRLDDAEGVLALDFTLAFDPALLSIGGATLGPGLPSDWSIVVNLQTSGLVQITAFGATALSGLDQTIVRLDASIPATAPLKSASILRFTDIELNELAIPARGDESWQQVGYFADVDVSGTYTGFDASLVAMVSANLATGFGEFRSTDPRILADVTANGWISGTDAAYIAQKAAMMPRPEIPDLPPTSAVPGPNGTSVELSIPSLIPAFVGATVDVPIDVNTLAATDGVYSATFEIQYDSQTLAYQSSDLGQFWPSTDGWSIVAHESPTGTVHVTVYNTSSSALGTGPIANLRFQVLPSAQPGIYPIQIAMRDDSEGRHTWILSHGSIEVHPSVPGDFDHSGSLDCQDVNALVSAIVGGAHPAPYDLNTDLVVDQADLAQWLVIAGAANNLSGGAYRSGDANLDGVVDGSDFGIWNAHKFTVVPAWCSGDFNADGIVDGSDFGIWNANKFTSSDGDSGRSGIEVGSPDGDDTEIVAEPSASNSNTGVSAAFSARAVDPVWRAYGQAWDHSQKKKPLLRNVQIRSAPN